MTATTGNYKPTRLSDYRAQERIYQLRGGVFLRPWHLTMLVNETKSHYTYARAEVIDQRPIPELLEILATNYCSEAEAKALVLSGRIVHLGESIEQCVFVGESDLVNGQPDAGSLFQRFVRWSKYGWTSDFYGHFKMNPKGQLGLIV